jgi:hypothetical protein
MGDVMFLHAPSQIALAAVRYALGQVLGIFLLL